MLNFSDIARKRFEDIKKPPLPPIGEYRFQITKAPAISTTRNGAWDIVSFPCQAVEALDTVDPDDLAKYGNVQNIRQDKRFMFDKNDQTAFERTEYDLKRFLGEHVKCWTEGQSLGEGLAAAVNQQFIGTINHTPDKNNAENFFANLGRTAPLT